MHDGLPLFAFVDAGAFSRWLAEHPTAKGAWLQFAKNGAVTTLSKAEAIDCALCHGWIDGQIRRLDDAHFLTRFTPRSAASRWSAKNAERAEALIAQGRMQPRGLAEIEAAKADGRWAAAYPSASRAETPPDFEAALACNAEAKRAFAALDGANRYAILYRLHHAKAEARNRRIADFVAMLARGETFHPKRPPRTGSANPQSPKQI
jgi:uncharacterized protein YdeI (YjbR/CyaY-like superfamily)